jgi:thioredoxin domain-containing protein 5
MDPVAPRRGRLPIHLLVVLLTVLVALATRSCAEVITLTEETFSDKVPPDLLGSLLSALPSSRGQF